MGESQKNFLYASNKSQHLLAGSYASHHTSTGNLPPQYGSTTVVDFRNIRKYIALAFQGGICAGNSASLVSLLQISPCFNYRYVIFNISKETYSMNTYNPKAPLGKRTLLATAILATSCSAPAWVYADEAAPFELGAVVVTAKEEKGVVPAQEQVASVITQEEMSDFNRNTVADALNLLSGATISNNTKNERKIFLRGFDSRAVGLFIDGIPVYVPYDGNIDLARFTTADLAAIQVAKGFSSVSYGPNTMGGAINLVSRKPTEKLEGDVRIGAGDGGERRAQANVGTNQGIWYLQGGLAYNKSDGFMLSSDFEPTTTEDGDQRENSYRKDEKASLKVGLTPNETDEYAISYYKQEAEKGQPPSTIPTSARYWQWPFWDKESIYLITNTALGSMETLKVRLFHDTYDNAINMYTDATYTTHSFGGTGPSIYHDVSNGGSVELESTRIKDNQMRLSVHMKKDKHGKYDETGFAASKEDMQDTLTSYAIEDNYRFVENMTLSLGAAHHELEPDTLFDSKKPTLTLPDNSSTTDLQAGYFYDITDAARFYTTAAKKSRLPTISDRYSQSMSTYIENPDLKPETAMNYEIGYQGKPWDNGKMEAAVFYSEVDDKIQTWYSSGASCTAANKCQRRNIGEVHISGLEFGVDTKLASQVELGGNYTYIKMKNVSDPSVKLTDVPEHKLVVDTIYNPVEQVDLVAFAEYNSKRWASSTVKLDGFTTLNLKAAYRPWEPLTLEAGVNNVTDENHELSSGFPSPGRMWFADVTYRF
jgi:iron complex outermembrane receptor protein